MSNAIQETNGDTSIRRLLALVFSILACISGPASIFFKLDWKIVAIAFGVPIVSVLILLLFTTWSEIVATIKAAKGQNE